MVIQKLEAAIDALKEALDALQKTDKSYIVENLHELTESSYKICDLQFEIGEILESHEPEDVYEDERFA